MAEWRPFASAGTYLLIAAVYLALGGRLLRRPATEPGQRAVRFFALWWMGLAGHSIVAAIFTLVGGLAAPPAAFVAAGTYLGAALIALMSWGLLYYLLFLFTGRMWVVRALTAVYALMFVGLVAGVAYAGPRAIDVQGWIPIILYDRPEGSALDPIAAIAFLVPPLVASGLYATLFVRVKDPAKRWRIALTGGAIFVWFTTSIAFGALRDDVAAIVGRSFALAAALSAFVAYEPPAWARRRFGATRLRDEVMAPPRDPHLDEQRRAALLQRAQEIV